MAALALITALVLVMGPARASTGGSAEATGVDLDFAGLTVEVGGIEIPVLPGEPGVTLVEAGTPAPDATGNGSEMDDLATVSLFADPPLEDVLNATVLEAATVRTTSALAARSFIGGTSVELFGVELVTTGDIRSQVLCPVEELGEAPTGSTEVVDLEVAGVPVAIGSVDIPVDVDIDVPGVLSTELLVSVTDDVDTDADSADAVGLQVVVTFVATGVGGVIVGEGTVLDLALAQSSCTLPSAVEPVGNTIDPDEGPVGTPVTITGAGFMPDETTVEFGDLVVGAGDVDVSGDGTSLIFLVPPGSPLGLTDVVVVTPGGETDPLVFTVTASVPPTATAIDPDEGPEGTVVEITGDDFVPGGTSIEFGDLTIDADDVDVADDGDTLTFEVPDDSPLGLTDVVVVTAGGESDPLEFTVTPAPPTVDAIDPDEGPETTVVTLTGDNFVPGDTTVEFGDLTIEADDVDVADDGDSLTIEVPDGAPLGVTEVVVVTDGGESDPVTFNVILGPPTIDGVDPDEGPPGTIIVIVGDGFVPGETTVEFGGVIIEGVTVSEDGTELSFEVPAGTTPGLKVITVETPGGMATGQFTVTDPDATTTTTTTTTMATTTTTAGGGGGSGGGSSTGYSSGGSLPRTGADLAPFVLVSLLALGVGAALVVISRRRATR